MASWASKRRLLYLSLIIGFFVVLFAYPVFSLFYKAPSCFDNKQNQNETGVDCGGLCERVCEFETVAPIVLWARGIEVGAGMYDAVARIENQNVNAGISRLPYSFKLYDDGGILIAERRGVTFINPNEQFTLFEGAIKTGKRIPVRTFFEFLASPQWTRVKQVPLLLEIQNQVLTEEQTRPRLRAEIINNGLEPVGGIVLTALVFNEENNAIAASKTEIDVLAPREQKTVSFIWPNAFPNGGTRIEIVPRVNFVE